MSVHRIVAMTYIPNPENKPEVNHIDGDKTNNNVKNLEWTTRKENAKHAFRTGLFGFGEDFSTSTMKNYQVESICEYLQNTNYSFRKIAKLTNSTEKIVSDICWGKTWGYMSFKYDFSNRKPSPRITENDAREICKLLITTNYTTKKVSEIVGCKEYVVKDIKRHKSWNKVYENMFNEISSTTRERESN